MEGILECEIWEHWSEETKTLNRHLPVFVETDSPPVLLLINHLLNLLQDYAILQSELYNSTINFTTSKLKF